MPLNTDLETSPGATAQRTPWLATWAVRITLAIAALLPAVTGLILAIKS